MATALAAKAVVPSGPSDGRVVSRAGTRISSWGNSEAVRIPRALLRLAGLQAGDSVEVTVNSAGNIELVPQQRLHRQARPERGVTFDKLFAGYEPAAAAPEPAWPDDAMVGAELEAWSR